MKKKIKIIDIFCKINCGEEVPHKIIYENHIYTYNSDVQDYDLNDNCEYLFEHLFTYKDTSIILELELEILDEEDEFEDIKPLVLKTFERTGEEVTTFRIKDYTFNNFEQIENTLAKVILNQKKIIERLKDE